MNKCTISRQIRNAITPINIKLIKIEGLVVVIKLVTRERIELAIKLTNVSAIHSFVPSLESFIHKILHNDSYNIIFYKKMENIPSLNKLTKIFTML